MFSQELPPIESFSSEEYNGDNQNWMVSQDRRNFIYVANNKGLLEYNGAQWMLYPSPNNTIVRAVNVIDGRIFTGCYGEFGFWESNNLGSLEYTSVSKTINDVKEEQVWNILEYNQWVIFQTNNRIYFYNTTNTEVRIIESSNIIYKIFKVSNQIYYHVAKEGLYVLRKGNPELLIHAEEISNERIIGIFSAVGYDLRFLTRNSGFFNLNNGKITPWNIEPNSVLKSISVFSAIQLTDQSYVLGTISDGILHLSEEGKINYQITQRNGLSNNTVLSLFEDNANNVWAGLDNGIDCINATSPIKTFFDYDGVMGTVYTTAVFKDILYMGSNQGLFYRKLNSTNENFQFIEGTAGQVWDLYNYEDSYLFCGHHLGTFIVENNEVRKISDLLGAWTFKRIPNNDNLILQGNYNGLHILEKENDDWTIRNKIEGFNNSSRYLEIDSNNVVWVNYEYKGVFKLWLKKTFRVIDNM